MKKFFIAFTIIAFSLSATSFVMAQDNDYEYDELEDRLKVSTIISAALPQDDNLKNGPGVHVDVSYDIAEMVSVGAEVGYTYYDVHALGVDWGKVHSIPMMGVFTIKYPMESEDWKFVPYIVNGFGALFTSVEEGSKVTNTGSRFDADTGFLYKIGGGIDIYLNDFYALSFESSYHWVQTDWQMYLEDASRTANVNPSGLYIGGGFKIKF